MATKNSKSEPANLNEDTLAEIETIFGNGKPSKKTSVADDSDSDEDEDIIEENDFSDFDEDDEEADDSAEDQDTDSLDAVELKKLLEEAQSNAEKYKALSEKNEKRAKASYKQLKAQKQNSDKDTVDEDGEKDIDSRIEAAVMRALQNVSKETNKISAKAEFNTRIIAALNASSFSKDQKEAYIKAISVDVAVNDDGTLNQEKLDQLISIIPVANTREKKNVNLGQGRSSVRNDEEDPFAWLK